MTTLSYGHRSTDEAYRAILRALGEAGEAARRAGEEPPLIWCDFLGSTELVDGTRYDRRSRFTCHPWRFRAGDPVTMVSFNGPLPGDTCYLPRSPKYLPMHLRSSRVSVSPCLSPFNGPLPGSEATAGEQTAAGGAWAEERQFAGMSGGIGADGSEASARRGARQAAAASLAIGPSAIQAAAASPAIRPAAASAAAIGSAAIGSATANPALSGAHWATYPHPDFLKRAFPQVSVP